LEAERELRTQIERSMATGLRWAYLDWHMVPEAGWPRSDMNEMFLGLCRSVAKKLGRD